MIRSLTVGFGAVTILAVAGSMTPMGQVMLGLRHPAAEQATPVTVIQDKPAPMPEPVQSVAAVPVAQPAPAPSAVVSHPAHVALPRPQARPAAPPAQRPQAAPQQDGPASLAGIASILLNLPQVLDRTHVGPSHGSNSDSWSESRSDSRPAKIHKKHHDQDEE